MADEILLYKQCTRCHGSGVFDQGDVHEDPCAHCNGEGYFEWGKVDNTLLQDIKDKCDDIWEKLNE